MSDIWLIFCLLVPLAEVLFHAVLDKYRYDVESEDEEVTALAKLHPKLAWVPKAKMEKSSSQSLEKDGSENETKRKQEVGGTEANAKAARGHARTGRGQRKVSASCS